MADEKLLRSFLIASSRQVARANLFAQKWGIIMGYMEENFFSDDDLSDLLGELEETENELEMTEEEKAEMEASNRRFREIIQKHKMD